MDEMQASADKDEKENSGIAAHIISSLIRAEVNDVRLEVDERYNSSRSAYDLHI